MRIQLSDDETELWFAAFEKTWRCDLTTYTLQAQPDKESAFGTLPVETTLKPSQPSQEETSITFVNRTDKGVKIYWLDTGGRRKLYSVLPPRQQRRQHTFTGHTWLVTDPNDKALAVFTAELDNTTADISEDLLKKPAIRPEGRPDRFRALSPDGKYQALIRDFNVFLKEMYRRKFPDHRRQRRAFYSRPYVWSPDSKYLAAIRTKKGFDRKSFD